MYCDEKLIFEKLILIFKMDDLLDSIEIMEHRLRNSDAIYETNSKYFEGCHMSDVRAILSS